ncbi:MAG: hypothetical protein AB7I57_18320 [Pirellulales bacterium]
MTKQEIKEALRKGATGHNAKFVNVRRDHLLIAVSDDEPAQTDEEPSVVTGEPTNEE